MKGIEPVLLARLLCAMVIVGCISASGVVCIELILTRAVFTSHQHLSSISLVGISHPHLSSVPSADARASPPSQSARMRAQNTPPERGFFQQKVRSSNRGAKSGPDGLLCQPARHEGRTSGPGFTPTRSPSKSLRHSSQRHRRPRRLRHPCSRRRSAWTHFKNPLENGRPAAGAGPGQFW